MNEMFVALISAVGSIIGTIIGITANTKLIIYRLEQLEAKVNKHNNIIERTYECEIKESILAEQINSIKEKIADIEKEE